MGDKAPDCVRVLSAAEVSVHLEELRLLLNNLPPSLPLSNQFYNFEHFAPNADRVEEFGSVESAVNQALEFIFCPKGRRDGPFPLKERGPGLVAVVDVLRRYTAEFPASVILQKWIFDAKDAARALGATPARIDIDLTLTATDSNIRSDNSCKSTKGNAFDVLLAKPTTPSAENGGNASGKKSTKGPPKKKAKTTLKDISASLSLMHRYVDLELDDPALAKGRGGVKACDLLDLISVACRRVEDSDTDGKVIYRCAGAPTGCDGVWTTPRLKNRVLKHAGACRHIPPEIQRRVNAELGSESLGAARMRLSAGVSSKANSPSPTTLSVSESFVDFPSVSEVASTSAPADAAAQVVDDQQSTVKSWAKKAYLEQLKVDLDSEIMLLVCESGIPPHIVSSRRWKSMWHTARPEYTPVSTSTLTDIQIPREDAFVREEQLKILQKEVNLTISFDGGTTKGQQSVYTSHIATSDRRVFFWDGNQASEASHTGEHIFKELDKIIEHIGPKRFRGITSDNTGNTSVARKKVQEKYKWIIILPDPCHRLNLLCKDICKISEFKPHMRTMQRAVKYFKKSTIAHTLLKRYRDEKGVTRGLRSVGKTRFATHYYAGNSLKECYGCIQDLCSAGVITIPDVNRYFTKSMAANTFICGLTALLTVLEPIAKALTCLESTHSTVSDVYVFWLAVTASMHDVLLQEGLEDHVKEQIRSAVNTRFNQMINEAPDDVYLTGFVIDPRFRGANILRDLNPLVISKLKITVGSNSKKATENLPDTLKRVGNYLLSMLRIEYTALDKKIAGLDIRTANMILKEQIRKFVKSEAPFDRPLAENQSPADWWSQMNHIGHAQPLAYLACILFSLTPNSMSDERTASTFTWLNTPLRNRQDVATLVRTVRIRQWYKTDEEKPEPVRPTVKFRDMDKTIFKQISKKRKRAGSESDSDESDDPDTNQKTTGASAGQAGGLEKTAGESEERLNLDIHDVLSDSDGDDEFRYQPRRAGKNFDASESVNLESPALRDLLADTQVPGTAKAKPNARTKHASEVEEVDLDDSEWLM